MLWFYSESSVDSYTKISYQISPVAVFESLGFYQKCLKNYKYPDSLNSSNLI